MFRFQSKARDMAGLGRNALVCSYFTLHGTTAVSPPRFNFEERARAAGRAGFDGIGIITDAYEIDRAGGLTDADMRAMLDDHGVVMAEVDFLSDWSADPHETDRVRHARALQDTAWAVADAFGPRVVNVGEIAGPEMLPPLEVVIERFASLCDRAAEHDLLVALEFLPWTGIPDIATAAAIVRGAERSNGGINVDSWHYFRGTPDDGLLREVADRVFMQQVDDAAGAPVGDLLEDTWLNRRYPGEGTFDLRAFVCVLDDAGASAPISVEICSAEHFALPVDEAAHRAYDSTRRVLDDARG
jgi:sugar phosphate isomerase/epimerase